MPRRSHVDPDEISREDIRARLSIYVPPVMRHFLEVEAKRIAEKQKRSFGVSDLVKALITSYYEKRLAGILVGPDD